MEEELCLRVRLSPLVGEICVSLTFVSLLTP
jgi:hypothetical protein